MSTEKSVQTVNERLSVVLKGQKVKSYAGQPSKVDTVNKAIMAMRTLSKLKSLLCHTLLCMVGWFTSPSLYTMYVPLR